MFISVHVLHVQKSEDSFVELFLSVVLYMGLNSGRQPCMAATFTT